MPDYRRTSAANQGLPGSDYTAEETEFIRAMEEYRRRYRPFPTCVEVLGVLKSLGYRHPDYPDPPPAGDATGPGDRHDDPDTRHGPWMVRFGTRIRAARRRAGLSCAGLAARCGLREVTVREAEDGSARPSEVTLAALARGLGCDPAELDGGVAAGRPRVKLTGEAAEVGPRVRSWRLALGLTTRGLAARAGMSKGTLTQIETGRHFPTPATLAALAAGLGCTPAELTGPPDVPGSPPSPDPPDRVGPPPAG